MYGGTITPEQVLGLLVSSSEGEPYSTDVLYKPCASGVVGNASDLRAEDISSGITY